MRRVPALLLALLALALCAAPAATAAAPSCAQMRAGLVRGGGGASGLYVIDAESGRVLCSRAPARKLTLASNMKLFTTAAALGELGPRTRIPTRLEALDDGDDDGIVRGNLFLVGGGDPVLGSPAFFDRFRGGLGTDIYQLVSKLRRSGVRRVTGRLVADDSVFDRLRGVADSGYATSPWIGPLSGLAFNSGYGSSGGTYFATDPARTAARKLLRALRDNGISIGAGIAIGRAPAAAEPLAAVQSPPLAQIADATNVPSDNFYAEMLIKLLGARRGTAGSTAAGAAVVSRFARERGSAVRAVDGSGLTRTNRASAAGVARLLRAALDEEWGDAFVASLALAGHEGTVATRMRGSAADGRCRTKTGTLTGVSALSGYCFNRSGRTVIFSVLMASVRDLGRAHLEQDRIAAAAARY